MLLLRRVCMPFCAPMPMNGEISQHKPQKPLVCVSLSNRSVGLIWVLSEGQVAIGHRFEVVYVL
jgi:hypothetical protein